MPTNKQLADEAAAQARLNAWAGTGPAEPIELLMGGGAGFLNPAIDRRERMDFEKREQDSPAVTRFRQEMRNIFDTVPLIRSESGKTITLRQNIIEDFARQKKSAKDANAFADKVLRQLSGESDDKWMAKQAGILLRRVSESIENPADYGPSAESAVTMDEYDEFKRQARVNPDAPTPRFRLNEAGQEQWQKQRYYDFLRAMQDGPNAPPYARPTSGVMQGLGVLGGIATYPLAMGVSNLGTLIDPAFNPPFDSNKYLQGQADNMRLAGNTLFGGVEGRMKTALYWLDRGKDAKATKDPITGANFPSRSMANVDGFGDQFNNYGNVYTAGNAVADIPARNFDLSLGQMAKLGNVRSQLTRDTPIIPDESLREKAKEAGQNISEHRNLQQQWLSANAPRAAYAFNDWLGTNITPSYLSSGASLFGQLPQEITGDLSSALTMGASAAKAFGRGGFKALPSVAKNFAKETLGEAPLEYAMSVPEEVGMAGPEQVQPDMMTWLFTAPKQLDAVSYEQPAPKQDTPPPKRKSIYANSGVGFDIETPAMERVYPEATDRVGYEKGLAAYNQRRSSLVKEIENYERSSAWAKAVREFQSGGNVPAWKLRSLRPTDKWTPMPTR